MSTKPWESVSEEAREVMREMGHFSPTVHALNREVKGYMLGADGEAGKCYWTANDLRAFSAAFLEVALWLDIRAEVAKATGDGTL